ncbi:UvrD-helicase domain-containing protein [Undibacterium sp. Di27W]|uniref:UvrD-helicase domain-containing protein n=1 Tax=Undibacterium sp. Di27W TaxID=3413036 RepID=UPI003BF00D61
MATPAMKSKKLSYEAEQVMDAITAKKNFLLSGGAGSGKTYSLVEVINALLEKYPLAKIACITYTNAAVREIEERIGHENLRVSTIHDFLWDTIKHFQNELKELVVELINDEAITSFNITSADGSIETIDKIEDDIRYKEYVKLREGIISHDELIILAEKMYARHKKLCRIVQNCYQYVLVDEYQDTDKNVVDILLHHLNQSDNKNIIGFFGDSMQSIYDDGVGNLDLYLAEASSNLAEIKKEQNRRNPQLIIDFANNLRTDGLKQKPSDDIHAPNMGSNGIIKPGSLKFLYSASENIEIAKLYLKWNFSDPLICKELNLTHNLIAAKAGFKNLMKIYDSDQIYAYIKRIKKYIKDHAPDTPTAGKKFGDLIEELKIGKDRKDLKRIEPTDGMKTYISENMDVYILALTTLFSELSSLYIDKSQLIDDKKNDASIEGRTGSNRDDLIKHLFKIQRNVHLYLGGNFNEFLRITDFKIHTQKDKKNLKEKIESLVAVGEKTIKQIIDEANENGIVKIDDRLIKFQQKKKYLYDQVASLPFSEFQKLFDYLEGYTPFTTQHKTKGAEFPNVLVILDNGDWNHYNFDYLFTEAEGKESVVSRTRKIFYVCCTRAKENLAVFYHQPSEQVLQKTREWFGVSNVINLDAQS